MSYIKNKAANLYMGDFECEMCGDCCRSGYNIYVNKEDVEKWKKLIKKKILDYIVLNPKCINVNIEAKLNFLLQDIDYLQVIIPRSFYSILKGLELGLEYILKPDISGKCPFLKSNLCSIQDFKPIGCIMFPINKNKCLAN
jgi:Fe-S-cluster containining protein